MKKLISALLAAGAMTLMAGCAYDDGYYRGGVGVAAGYGGYDGYYDDYYGPIYDGYWGPSGSFYFSTGPGHRYLRDEGVHFRHDSHDGFHSFHGGQHVGRAGRGDEHRPG